MTSIENERLKTYKVKYSYRIFKHYDQVKLKDICLHCKCMHVVYSKFENRQQ